MTIEELQLHIVSFDIMSKFYTRIGARKAASMCAIQTVALLIAFRKVDE